MKKSTLLITLLILCLTGASFVVRGQTINSTNERPGDVAYAPTKLEWAALELQAQAGNTNWTSETPVTVTFIDSGDGRTVRCVLQYTPEVPAAVVKINRDASQKVFDIYANSRGWPWLRLQFDERVLRR